ncbi:MAG TPA: hypothetical protein VG711_04350, partial [Phycisphaerales bacterium]|nr:hypothetical protein [Phycisphaerales bacterium]
MSGFAFKNVRRLAAAIVGIVMWSADSATFAQEGGIVPQAAALSDPAQKAVEAPWLKDEERAALRVFHGVWDDRDLISPRLRAEAALQTYALDDEVFADPQTPAELRAEAALLRGDLEQAIALTKDLTSNEARRIEAEAYESLGKLDDAKAACKTVMQQMLKGKQSDAESLTQGVRTMFVNARLEGQPGRDFQTMLDLLGRATQEMDRLYWPAKVAEAELLFDKDHDEEAIGAAHEALSLDPRCSKAWYMLGKAALDRFDFDGALRAITALHRLNPVHPLADILQAESRLVQDDPEG